MTSYEATFVFRPEAEATERGKQAVQDIFARAATRISGEDDVGERALAYPIAKQDRGHYTRYEIETDPQSVQGIYQAAGLLPEVLKCFIVRRDPLARQDPLPRREPRVRQDPPPRQDPPQRREPLAAGAAGGEAVRRTQGR